MYRRAVMLSPCPTGWRRFLPSWGWRCTGCWWCCWTSPVPLGDSSYETADCCTRERKTTCYHTHSLMLTIYSMLAVQLPNCSANKEHFLFMGVHCHLRLSDRVDLNTAVFALYCFAFQIQGQWLISLYFPFLQSIRLLSWNTARVQFSQQFNDWFVSPVI